MKSAPPRPTPPETSHDDGLSTNQIIFLVLIIAGMISPLLILMVISLLQVMVNNL